MKQLILTAATMALMTSSALAGGFGIREQSAEGLGAAFAGMAAGSDGLSSMFWNPATISQHNSQGFISETNASLILPYSQSGAGLGFPRDSGNIGQAAIVPASYMSYGISDEVTVALAINAPFGLTTDSQLWAGSALGKKSSIFSLNANPVIAYKPADWLTLAVGAQGEYFKVNLTNVTAGGVTLADVTGDNFGFGFNAGVLLQPTSNIDIGLSYRSSIHHGIQGSGRVGPYNGPIAAVLDTPDMINFGLKLHANDQLTLMAGAEWAGWSKFKNLTLTTPGGTVLNNTPENWKDSWFFSGGAEYALNDVALLRAGVGYEISPVPDATRTVRLPDNDRIWLSVGASYKISDMFTANLGYSHLFVKDGPVPGVPVVGTANFIQHVDIVSASATIDW